MSMIDEGLLSAEVYAKHTLGEDQLVGGLKAPLNILTCLGNDDREFEIYPVKEELTE
jgi:hypothetical protein